MKQLNIREMRANLTCLDELLAREGEILITRHGKPIARLVTVRTEQKLPSHAALRARMPRLKMGSEALVRADRDAR